MDADIERKPVAAIHSGAPMPIAGCEMSVWKEIPKIPVPMEDPLIAAGRRMRLEDEIDAELRNEEIEKTLDRIHSYRE